MQSIQCPFGAHSLESLAYKQVLAPGALLTKPTDPSSSPRCAREAVSPSRTAPSNGASSKHKSTLATVVPAPICMFYNYTECHSDVVGNELHQVLNLATLPVMALQHSQELISFCLQVNELKTKIYGLRQQQQKYLSKMHNVSSCQIYSTLFTMLMCDARLLLSGRSTRFIFPDLSQMMASFNCLFFPECIHPYLLNGVFSTMGRENKLNFNQRVSILITAGLLSLYGYQ